MVDINELRVEGSDFAKAVSENADESDKRDMLLVLAGIKLAKTINKVDREGDKPEKASQGGEKMLNARIAPQLYSFTKEIMEEIEKRAMTREEAEALPEVLAERIRKNNERIENSKPFVVFKTKSQPL